MAQSRDKPDRLSVQRGQAPGVGGRVEGPSKAPGQAQMELKVSSLGTDSLGCRAWGKPTLGSNRGLPAPTLSQAALASPSHEGPSYLLGRSHAIPATLHWKGSQGCSPQGTSQATPSSPPRDAEDPGTCLSKGALRAANSPSASLLMCRASWRARTWATAPQGMYPGPGSTLRSKHQGLYSESPGSTPRRPCRGHLSNFPQGLLAGAFALELGPWGQHAHRPQESGSPLDLLIGDLGFQD